MIVAGRLLGQLGPRAVAAIGGLFLGGGYCVAAHSAGNFNLLLLGIGGLAGVGTGFCYVCPIALSAKWFPHRKGLATGIVVAGFGGGAILLAQIAEWMLAGGVDVLNVFGRIGLIYGAIIVAAAIPLRFPDSTEGKPVPVNFAAVLQDWHFWELFSGIFAGTFAGLLVIGNLKPMLLSKGIDSAIATASISVFAAGNAMGRIFWGWLVDRRKTPVIPLSLAMLAFSLGLLAVIQSSTSAVIVSFLTGIAFGSCFVIYAAQAGYYYGARHVAAVYPIIFLSYGLSGLLGPLTGGWICDFTGSYQGGLIVGIAVATSRIGLSLGLSYVDTGVDVKAQQQKGGSGRWSQSFRS